MLTEEKCCLTSPQHHKPSALMSSASPLFTSRASIETTLHTASTEAGTKPARSTGEAKYEHALLQLSHKSNKKKYIYMYLFHN